LDRLGKWVADDFAMARYNLRLRVLGGFVQAIEQKALQGLQP
jgi:hypothetical protein